MTILTTDFHFDNAYARQCTGVEVIPIKCSMHLGLYLYSPQIKTWISKNLPRYNIIHMQNYRSYQNATVCYFAQKYGVPYVIQAHGSLLPFFENQTLKHCFDIVWGNRILSNAKKVIASTDHEKKQYIRMGIPDYKIEIIPNGIDFSSFRISPSQRDILDRSLDSLMTKKLLLFSWADT